MAARLVREGNNGMGKRGYEQFLAAIEDYVIEQARIVGRFEQ